MHSWLVLGLSLVAACQHVDDLDEDGPPGMPASTEESQRINVDEIGPRIVPAGTFERLPWRGPGVAPVTAAFADPRYPITPRRLTVAFEDSPPPEPVSRLPSWFALLSGSERTIVNELCREIRADPCMGELRDAESQPSRFDTLFAALGPNSSSAISYCSERDGQRQCVTPLVVAFDGLVEIERSAGTFAFDPGAPVATDWPTAKTPWIALDRDGDGAITSGAELFGDATVVPAGKAANGFAALAALDANGDRVIDARDPAFASLLLWADDGDRKSSRDELRPLSEVITVIPLDHDVVRRCARGNCEGERGVMSWRDGDQLRTGAVIDLYLRHR